MRVFHNIHIKKLALFTLIALLAYACLFVLLYFLPSEKFKPGTRISNIEIGSLNTEEAKVVVKDHLARKPVTITSDLQSSTKQASDLGVNFSQAGLESAYHKQRLRFAIFPFGYPKDLLLDTKLSGYEVSIALKDFDLPEGANPPVDASYELDSNNQIVIRPSKKGIGIDRNNFTKQVIERINRGESDIIVKVSLGEIDPFVKESDLELYKAEAQKIADSSYVLNSETDEVSLPVKKIISSLASDGTKLVLPSKEASSIILETTNTLATKPTYRIVQKFASGANDNIVQEGQDGYKPSNDAELASLLQKAVSESTSLSGQVKYEVTPYATKSININDRAKRVISYSVISWGKVRADIGEFKYNSAETLNSSLGWARADIAFKQVDSNPDFWLVLAEPNELSRRYPAICSAYYSCRVGNFVMINDDRWRTATPPWTLSLRDYQNLVVNHETGHWLDLRDARTCPSQGEPALVMQQQSIDLDGCTFNPWPLDSEIERIKL